MTKEEIIEMAKQVGFEEHQAKFDTRLEPFAKLVAQHEREACATICEQLPLPEWPNNIRQPLAQAIRARGQA